MLTQFFATLLQPIDGLLDVRQREILGGKGNDGPKAAGSRAEKLPSHDIPRAVGPRLLLYVHFNSKASRWLRLTLSAWTERSTTEPWYWMSGGESNRAAVSIG